MSQSAIEHIKTFSFHSFSPSEPVSTVQPSQPVAPDVASPAHLPDSNPHPALRPVQISVTAAPGMGNIPADPDDEEGLKHLEQVTNLLLEIYYW